MDNVISVTEVIELDFKTGYSEKTKKDWSLSKYKASNGVEFSSFDHLEVGDVIVLEKNGEYWNGRKPKQSDKQHDEIMGALRNIYKELQIIKKGVVGQPDTVKEVSDDPISLDDIPY